MSNGWLQTWSLSRTRLNTDICMGGFSRQNPANRADYL